MSKTSAKPSEPKHYGKHDGLCHHEHQGERCPLPGNIALGGSGPYGTFYCLWHSHATNRRIGFMQDEHYRIYSDRDCVKDFVEMNYLSPVEAERGRIVADNPEWRRTDQETKSAYVKRIRGIVAPLLGCVNRLEGDENPLNESEHG